jgi:hypothetical protein
MLRPRLPGESARPRVAEGNSSADSELLMSLALAMLPDYSPGPTMLQPGQS